MNDLTYSKERTLSTITLVLGILAWLGIIIGTMGMALGALLLGFIVYLFAQSTLISYIRGNGVELSETQFPDLYAQFTQCCDRLQIASYPKAYILNGNGVLNAFATNFLRTKYVVLLSSVVDAMEKHEDGVRFYFGHELGHLRRKHIEGTLIRSPVLWLPLLGAAYSRARESTCDKHGLACSQSAQGAVKALAALAAGAHRWEQLNVAAYLQQSKYTSGFWMSFHELTAGYPWLTKRAARMTSPEAELPKRNRVAYIFAAFVPYAGRLGAGFGVLLMVYVIGMIAAIGIPAYQDYTDRAKVNVAAIESKNIRDALGRFFETNGKTPASLDALGLPSKTAAGSALSYDPRTMVLTITTPAGDLIFNPSINDDHHVVWACTNGENLKPSLLPTSCKSIDQN